MSDLIKKDLGTVSAYKYAKLHGYTGTEEEFGVLMASYASVAQEASRSASSAAESATDAGTKANEAKQSAQSASQLVEAIRILFNSIRVVDTTLEIGE